MFRGENYSLDVDPAKYYGRKIVEVARTPASRYHGEESLFLKFEDGVSLRIYDAASYCCEHRFMTCDDDIQSLVGGNLVSIETKAGPTTEQEYDFDDIEFLEIRTDKSFITVANHNSHNGYYGGFEVALVEQEFPDV